MISLLVHSQILAEPLPVTQGTEPEFVNLLKEPENRFPAWRAGLTTLFEGPPGYIGWRNRSRAP